MHVVPLLFETGYDRLVDKSVLVVAPLEQRVARVVERDQLTPERVRARWRRRFSRNEARARADFVIENDGNLDRLREAARAIYARLAAERRRLASILREP